MIPGRWNALLTLHDNSSPFSHFTYQSCHLSVSTAKPHKCDFSKSTKRSNHIKQVQRYSLSNHLCWLVNDRPGGIRNGVFLIRLSWVSSLKNNFQRLGRCDMLVASFSRT